jgi:hypothetical protein
MGNTSTLLEREMLAVWPLKKKEKRRFSGLPNEHQLPGL